MNSDSQESNNNNLEKPYQSSKDKTAGEKAAHVAGKGASKRMMPGVGGNLYNASNKTPIGKGFEKMAGRKIGNNPQLQASQSLNKSGALDKSNDGNNSALDSVNKTNDSNKNADLEKSSSNNSNTSKNGKRRGFGRANGGSSKMSGDVMGNEEDESTQSSFSLFLDFLKKQKFPLTIAGTSIFTFFCCFLYVFIFIGGILFSAYLAEDLYKGVSDFFEKTSNFLTFNGLVTDQEKAIKAKKAFYEKLKTVRDEISTKTRVNGAENGVQIDVTLIETTLFYNQGLDFDAIYSDSTDVDVVDFDETSKSYKEAKKKIKQLAMMQVVKIVTEHECSDPVGSPKMDYRTDKEIAEDYQNQFFQSSLLGNQFATKNNVVYHEYDTVTVTNPDGTESEEEVCNAPDTDITYSLSTDRDGIYYYNLISPRNGKSFIEKYYAEELGENYSYDDLVEIVDDIYDLYEYVRKRRNSTYNSVYAECANGITVISGTGEYARDPANYPIGTFDLEEYVAMVVNGENNSGYAEAMKAQIIAARTYTLVRSNNCTKPIRNSIQDQVAKANPTETIRQLVEETSGMVLTYNGDVFSSEYDSFKGSCSGGTCTGVYTKLPNGEKHTVTIPSKFSEGIGGHGRGMSQCGANYMASTGSTYEQILKFFYSDGVEISLLTPGNAKDSAGSPKIQGLASEYLIRNGSSIEEFNASIKEAVDRAGPGTRSGVVAAAIALVSGFHEKTGYNLNYVFGGVRYQLFGITNQWGINGNGLDCSGFISWAIYNGGYNFEQRSSSDWGNAGPKRLWRAGMEDTNAEIGDLIWHSGHIIMIVGKTSSGYVTAEAASTNTGMVIRTRPYNNAGSSKDDYIVDMSGYYADYSRVNLSYPK